MARVVIAAGGWKAAPRAWWPGTNGVSRSRRTSQAGEDAIVALRKDFTEAGHDAARRCRMARLDEACRTRVSWQSADGCPLRLLM